MSVGVKSTAAWRLARGLKRHLFAPRANHLLPPEQCRSAVRLVNPPVALEAGQAFALTARVENRAGVAWAGTGPKPVKLRAEWFTHAGEPFPDAPPAEMPLPSPVFPGEPAEVALPCIAPRFVGDFALRVDLVQDVPFTESNAESTAADVAIPVQGPRATDIDYHAVFRTADLAANHWWVVGAYHTKEQYEASSRDRLGMLVKEAGLTPDSRVLDVGCGTGQMAGALAPYLSDRGAYAGTDIGKEAVEFCERTFRRRNFAFLQGGMTTIPFDGTFDLAIFFSVFTHTFADETALLLGETRRLLRPGGVVMADVILSPLVTRGAGHRGEMVLNRGHFERLAAMVGFSADPVGCWDWNPHAERRMYRLRLGHV